jgi:glycosyltransferase involved in cell wall biosynthesis
MIRHASVWNNHGTGLPQGDSNIRRRILYTHTASWIGGGNKVLLNLFESLDRSRFQPISVLPEPGPMESELRRLEVPYFILDLRPGNRSRMALAWQMVRLAGRRLQVRPDILHANDPYTYRGATQIMPWNRLLRICTIYHPGQSAGALEWALKTAPHLIVTCSQFMKQQLAERVRSRASTRLEAVWLQIDLDWFRPVADVKAAKASLGLDPAGHDVSILAALAPHKGHICFLRMARQVLDALPRTTFHIVGSSTSGDKEHAAELRRLAAELGIAERVRFWGFVPDEAARNILCASDLFVLPTREEGFGLSVAEAQACQVPVLASAIQPLDEVVDDGRSGYLIPPDDWGQFARRAVELLQAENVRREMGASGRRWVHNRFGRQAYVGRMMDLYEEVAEQVGGVNR